MSAKTGIAWTDATWNPTVGCSKVSDGCRNCYAMGTAHRLAQNPNPKVAAAYDGLTVHRGGRPEWSNVVRCLPDRLEIPLRWKRPRMVFVNSMSDLFHPDVPDPFIDQVFGVMALCPQHQFQVLTKRPERMRDYLAFPQTKYRIWVAGRLIARNLWPHKDAYDLMPVAKPGGGPKWCYPAVWPLKNAWLGVSVEDQATADERIPLLLECPAAVRWISAEPLLGPVDLTRLETPEGAVAPLTGQWAVEGRGWSSPSDDRLHWIVTGGESGTNARPAHPDWFRDLRDQCAAAGVPFYFKQWGGARAASGGHLLDGVEHREYPK